MPLEAHASNNPQIEIYPLDAAHWHQAIASIHDFYGNVTEDIYPELVQGNRFSDLALKQLREFLSQIKAQSGKSIVNAGYVVRHIDYLAESANRGTFHTDILYGIETERGDSRSWRFMQEWEIHFSSHDQFRIVEISTSALKETKWSEKVSLQQAATKNRINSFVHEWFTLIDQKQIDPDQFLTFFTDNNYELNFSHVSLRAKPELLSWFHSIHERYVSRNHNLSEIHIVRIDTTTVLASFEFSFQAVGADGIDRVARKGHQWLIHITDNSSPRIIKIDEEYLIPLNIATRFFC